MNEKKSALRAVIAASGFAMLISSAALAAPRAQDDYSYRVNRISAQGEITSISREGDQYRVVLNDGTYAYYVPMSTIRNRDIRVGDHVRIGGIVSGEAVTADYVAFSGEPSYA